MRETLEGERQSWLNHQTQSLSQKEAEIREQLKKEKDHHVEIIMKKMEEEMQVKAKALEHKIAYVMHHGPKISSCR
ncbi:unnamed protein product [Nesidiocoris tenuis]|uniref:Uncharacterized protein n=1 Tax=Nesidiocoris tenuis TaxID=355587 RepID=A0A6H5G5Y1_9HEMI|nr:unnamed protein product [Nesidiocoris tenuis]